MSEQFELPQLREKHLIVNSARMRRETDDLRQSWYRQKTLDDGTADVDYWATIKNHLPSHILRQQLHLLKKSRVRFAKPEEKKESPQEARRREFNERWDKEVVKKNLNKRICIARPVELHSLNPITGKPTKKIKPIRPTFEETFFYQSEGMGPFKGRYFIAPDWKSEKVSWKYFNEDYVQAIHLRSVF